jgi:multiple sugar transport system substrate-binding protein
MDDYVGYLKAPVGTWNGKTYISIDGDCHSFNYRTDYFSDPDLAKAWKDAGSQGEWGVRRPGSGSGGDQVPEGKKIRARMPTYLDPTKPWGGFAFYFWAAARRTRSTRTTRRGCSTSTP